MVTTNAERSQQLGMSYGTACHRLRQQVMFDLIRRLGEDWCYRCGERIASAKELSLEHKQDWFRRDAARFWDLGNIAFSHRRCNRPNMARDTPHRGGRPRISGPEGTAWCRTHEQFLPRSEFWAHRSRWNGLQADCITCVREARGVGEQVARAAQTCKQCGSDDLMPNRRVCVKCYRKQQKEKMRRRREGATTP